MRWFDHSFPPTEEFNLAFSNTSLASNSSLLLADLAKSQKIAGPISGEHTINATQRAFLLSDPSPFEAAIIAITESQTIPMAKTQTRNLSNCGSMCLNFAERLRSDTNRAGAECAARSTFRDSAVRCL